MIPIFPPLPQPTIPKITPNHQLPFPHFPTLTYSPPPQLPNLFKPKSKSTQHIKFPNPLTFLTQTTIT
ncbi:PTS transporter subunit IIC, partial [Staphylococcus pasteuri]|uniref:PTS transporter subunit IIC n=1 Tax=Staphylococcus pasteuri TaxID=45972 RepID=UPI0036F2B639